jgi:hypothetical protein
MKLIRTVIVVEDLPLVFHPGSQPQRPVTKLVPEQDQVERRLATAQVIGRRAEIQT